MEEITNFFASFGLNLDDTLVTVGIILLGALVLALAGRFIFGNASVLVAAVSSAIGVLFVYVLNIVLQSAGAEFQRYTTVLPFITISGSDMTLFSFIGSDYTAICSELVSILILAFLMNLIDQVLPKGKNVFVWLLMRVLTVVLAQTTHLIVTGLMNTFLPEGILIYAPVILLGILLLMLLTGALKFLVGLVLTTVNPLIAALYTFFFANVVGKQITKAVLTTGILALLVFGLEKLGITTICIAAGALTAYIPFAVLLLVMWYIVLKLF